MTDRPIPPDDLFDDLDEYDGYDDVTGPHYLAAGDEYGDYGAPEDPDFWVDSTPTAFDRLTGAVQTIRATRTDPSGSTRRHSVAGRPARPVTRPGVRQRPSALGARRHIESIPGLQSPFARRVAVIAAAVLLAAPIVSAMRPTDAEAEPVPSAAPTASASVPASAAPAQPISGDAGQPPSATIDMSALPLLTRPSKSTPTSAAVAAQVTCGSKYTVVSGDSWSLIADKVSVSLSSLLAVNDATTRSVLLVGEVICLPQGASAPTTNAPPTTKAPTTTRPPSTTVAPPSGPTYTAAQIEAIIREIWPDDLEDTALYIARRESNLNPYARNWCCYGLFQIYWEVHDVWLIPRGITSASQLFDPRTNTTVALWVYQRSGSFRPWGM